MKSLSLALRFLLEVGAPGAKVKLPALPRLAWVYAGLAVVNRVLMFVWRQ
ncbi:MAG TPA: hypothetical protein VK464_05775 [Symbiobacteriaceae bacterium]|jgi:hypothetical protein|nr:hypothetical protein [Symbiobacteriaceae bacterium]